MTPGGPTLAALNREIPEVSVAPPLPRPLVREAAALNPANRQPPPGRDNTAPGLGDEALARARHAGFTQPFTGRLRGYAPGAGSGVNHGMAPAVGLAADSAADANDLRLSGVVQQMSRQGEDTENRPPVLPKQVTSDLRTTLLLVNLSPDCVRLLAAQETQTEKSGGWGNKNPDDTGVAWGRFQFRQPALEDVGMMDKKGNWTGRKYGVHSGEDFRDNMWAQLAALEDWVDKLEGYADTYGLTDYIDERDPITVEGRGGSFEVTKGGLLVSMHFA